MGEKKLDYNKQAMNNKLIKIALGEYGVTEIKGATHNERILEYFHSIGHKWVKTDETAWCSAFINWVALQAGKEMSGELNARSWLKVGTELKVPEVGDVVVFWRESRRSWKGHVGLFIRETETHVYVLGGNQNNQVNIKAYPKYRVLSYRRLGRDEFPKLK